MKADDTISIKIHSKHATAFFFEYYIIFIRQRKTDQSHAMMVKSIFITRFTACHLILVIKKKYPWRPPGSEYQKKKNTQQRTLTTNQVGE